MLFVAFIVTDGAKPKRTMSAAARKRIAAAQKKRWAAFHQSKDKSAPKTAVKKAAPTEGEEKIITRTESGPGRKLEKKHGPYTESSKESS